MVTETNVTRDRPREEHETDMAKDDKQRAEKIIKESRKQDGSPDEHPYEVGDRVLLDEAEAKRLEVKGYAIPLGGWHDEKDQGETKTDNDVGYGYGPAAVNKRKSNVARAFTQADLDNDVKDGSKNDRTGAGTSAGAAANAGS
jgi:hypothetical protein